MEYSKLIAQATDVERADFYRKVYSYVGVAILAFIAVETFLLQVIPIETILSMVSGKFTWLFILGLFWLGSFLANRWTMAQSRSTQYMGLGVYVLLEAIIFLPMISIAMVYAGTEILSQAGLITLALFGGLTAVVFFTKTDFSFLRTALVIGGFVALGFIVAGAIFGFNLGLWFSVAMILLASGGILYETYNLKNHYHTEQYVGAALQLFASVMLIYWYVLRILLSRRS